MKVIEPPRTPMWAMSDEQLRCYAEDELVSYEKRLMARTLLNERAGDVRDQFPDNQGDALASRLGNEGVTP